jgi:hypothetical protein
MVRALMVSVVLLTAGILAGSVCAEAQSQQDADQASAAHGTSGSGAGSSGAAGKAKPKKVWTNDDMSDVTGTISVVGTPRQAAPKTPATSLAVAVPSGGNSNSGGAAKTSKEDLDPKTLANLRQTVQKLQANLDQLDRQIEQLRGASHGDSKNLGVLTSDPSQYSMEPVPEQIKALEAKKKSQQTTMDNLLDTARALGIEPGQLR